LRQDEPALFTIDEKTNELDPDGCVELETMDYQEENPWIFILPDIGECYRKILEKIWMKIRRQEEIWSRKERGDPKIIASKAQPNPYRKFPIAQGILYVLNVILSYIISGWKSKNLDWATGRCDGRVRRYSMDFIKRLKLKKCEGEDATQTYATDYTPRITSECIHKLSVLNWNSETEKAGEFSGEILLL